MQRKTYCRVAPSLGALEADHTSVWGTLEYDPKKNRNEPTVFFGLYDLRDYYALWRHKGKKWVLWAGSDLENLIHGFLFNDGKLKTLSKIFRGNAWVLHILRKAEHWVEDVDEAKKLVRFGIMPQINPSFLGNIDDFPVSYTCFFKPHVYVSGHPGREDEYGFEIVRRIAPRCPSTTFHLYGSMPDWKQYPSNIVLHGKVPKEQFNREIKKYQCGLRLNKTDGFSEITAKSILMGQYPLTHLEYPCIPNFENEDELVQLINSLNSLPKYNRIGREYYIQVLNNYPWRVI